MLFSQEFRIKRTAEDDWFDPVLVLDTALFIDPFLIFDGEFGVFKGSHNEVVSFFDFLVKLVARSGGDRNSRHWRKATALLALGEVYELCLGYSSEGTQGSGSGRGLANGITSGLWAAVRQGIQHLEHFEEVQIFQEGVGPDRISDAIAGILRHRIASYTEAVAKRHKLTTKPVRYLKAKFEFENQRWTAAEYLLPINPYSNKPILLIPKDYLRPLPTINPDDFWGYCYDTEPDTLREQFGDDLTRRVDKETIIALALAHPEFRERYVQSKELQGSESYDLAVDREGFYQPLVGGLGWAHSNPLAFLIQSSADLLGAVQSFVNQFKVYVEDNSGWELLWNDDGKPKRERAFQALFQGIVIAHCIAHDIDVSREANIGRGPVDFKFSKGYRSRVLLEAKLANNSKFWSGLKKQLPKYLEAEEVQKGVFLVACLRDQDFKRLKNIRQVAKEVSNATGREMKVEVIDCRAHPTSASAL